MQPKKGQSVFDKIADYTAKVVQRKKILQDGVSRKYYRMGCCFWGRVYKKLPQDMGEGESGFFVTMRYEICLLKCF